MVLDHADVPVLEACGIRVAIGNKILLEDVHLKLAAGKVTALLGPNGAGKSTLLKVLSGTLPPDSGGIRLNGSPLPGWTSVQCARMRAVLLQDPQLPFAFTVEEVARMGRYPHLRGRETGRDRAIVRDSLEVADMLPRAERLYPTLSGGEKQRTHWARVLAQLESGDASPRSMRGKCLLLDEPTSSLDLSHQHALLEHARELAACGAGVLVILHDLNLAAQYADELVLMQAGRIVAAGGAGAVMTPSVLKSVYGVDARVVPHPEHGRPWMYVRPAPRVSPASRATLDPRPSFSTNPQIPA